MNNGSHRTPRIRCARPRPAAVDREVDIVVVGGGGGGLPAALFSRWLGNNVVILEKAASVGGTAIKAAFWYWVPNNAPMRRPASNDPQRRLPALRRAPDAAAQPTIPTHPRSASRSGSTTCARRSTTARRRRPSCWRRRTRCRTATAPRCRTTSPSCETRRRPAACCFPKDAAPPCPTAARWPTRTLSHGRARATASTIRTGHRVQSVILNDEGEVIGVEADRADGTRVAISARKAVIFATGGFTHDVELRKNFLSIPVYGGCAAMTNEGDFVRIASSARRAAAQHELRLDVPDLAREGDREGPVAHRLFSVAGDSMIFVDKHGKRVVNEKLALQRAGAEVLRVGRRQRAVPVPRADLRSGTSARRTTRRATSTAA